MFDGALPVATMGWGVRIPWGFGVEPREILMINDTEEQIEIIP
jgi:hypothetical protein